MFIRRTKSRNSTCFQIGEKQAGRFVVKQHVGCASTLAEIETLKLKARQLLYEWRYAGQLPLIKGNKPPTAKLINWKVTGFHRVFGTVYDRIGFPNSLLRDLVIARIAYPKSKAATLRYLDKYLGIKLKKDILYRFLDTLDKDKLTQIAFNFVSGHHPHGVSVCFYDVTTLYFETTQEDGVRQKGYSKDHRMDTPQILIGLFVDSRGYPFDFDFYEGRSFEGHTFIKAMKSILRKYHFPQLTAVADAGMLSKDNLEYLDSIKINYIVGARLKNLTQNLAQQILSHQYMRQPIFQTTIDTKRLLVDYSVVRAKLDAKNRGRAVAKLKQKLADKKAVVRKSKYLLTEGKSNVVGLDDKQIKADQQFDGLKGYFTNSNNQSKNSDIIAQYHQLWRVEKAFRMSKHDLRERPIFHYQKHRIKAHLTLCFVSLLVMKETERYLTQIDCTLERAIELLGRVGQGIVKIGSVDLITESELDPATQLIHNIFEGH